MELQEGGGQEEEENEHEPLKKMPSTAANATRRSANESLWLIHRMAQSAFFLTHGTVCTALNNLARSVGSLIRVSINKEYVSL
jgi:hypothetical protein